MLNGYRLSWGFGNTEGSKQTPGTETQADLIAQLKMRGTKISEQDVVFATRDRSNQIIWLEKGNSFAGLEHIIQRHENDFKQKHKINQEKISKHLKVVFSSGEIEYSRLVNKNGREGYEKLYRYKNQYYLLTGVGTNGFIVTSYPIDSASARKLKERYGK